MATTTSSNQPSPFPTTSSAAGSTGSESGLGSSGVGLDSPYTGSSTASSLGSTDKTLDRFVQSAHQAVDSLAAKAVPAVERLKSTVGTASDTVHQRADQLGALQEEWIESARATVREHPLASVFAAVAVGMLISRMTSSR